MESSHQELIPSQTNDTFLPLYTFYEPETFSGNSCPLCSFSGNLKELATHYKSKEHFHNLSKARNIPEEWYEKTEEEDETCHYLRSLVACHLGPLPRNIKSPTVLYFIAFILS
ncbi:conserved hypothetical protein [Lausannevirus]|uniref:Uncharacterized protein n=1 Tax=Lausannevirus TaxID=999883 RepID=F2WM27_9VIRU|nr:hypothetical protein LAU_0450 [Lausannevirus]AEA07300.1 conserved hypothetical protein [Lausannevirus]